MLYQLVNRHVLPCTEKSHACHPRSCWRFTCSASNPAGVCKAGAGSVTVLITDSCPECKSKNNADFDTQARR